MNNVALKVVPTRKIRGITLLVAVIPGAHIKHISRQMLHFAFVIDFEFPVTRLAAPPRLQNLMVVANILMQFILGGRLFDVVQYGRAICYRFLTRARV